jgi:hypothetical protein
MSREQPMLGTRNRRTSEVAMLKSERFAKMPVFVVVGIATSNAMTEVSTSRKPRIVSLLADAQCTHSPVIRRSF